MCTVSVKVSPCLVLILRLVVQCMSDLDQPYLTNTDKSLKIEFWVIHYSLEAPTFNLYELLEMWNSEEIKPVAITIIEIHLSEYISKSIS